MTFRVVGIGASAGGLEAVSALLGALPAGTGIAYIVVQHLDPRHESLLPEILAKTTSIPVSAAVDAEVVQPDHVYVIPPNTTLTVADTRLQLTERPAVERHLPIDALFKSLALAYGENAIGVVMSGADSDGSLGIQAIKHEGGIVFAQSPGSARFPDMPRHAIETGHVDRVMSPGDIAAQLIRLGQQPAQTDAVDRSAGDKHEALLKRIFRRIREAHGIDFSHYKRSTLRRRLDRRMTLHGSESLEEYCEVIDSDPAEVAALFQDFLIRVTEFFRDPELFEQLRKQTFFTLAESRDAGQPIRIWVPGCATGEEVYSVAIELLESIGGRLTPTQAQIFGTDVSEAALEKARAGVYQASGLRDVTSERIQRFFDKQGNDYRIVKEIRDLCIFARQDVTHDPPFPRLDLISCRNLLIYLDEVAQRRIMQAFHFALRPNGALVIGPAETIGQSSELFEQVDKHFRIYRRRGGSRPGTTGQFRSTPRATAQASPDGDMSDASDATSISHEADRWLLARFAPASLLVDEELTIRQFRGRTGPFLEPAPGPPSLDLRHVVRPELLVELLPAVRQARESGLPVRRDALRLHDERDVSVEVVPLTGPAAGQGFLILLDDGSPQRGRSTTAGHLSESEKDQRLSQLQYENDALRDFVRVTIEEQGAIQEELKSSQEEMLSANEEFQSTNEELETSKEELQSTNEELTTTIDELRHRNRELGVMNVRLDVAREMAERAQAYADIIIETVRSPLAVIDGEMKIKRVNRAFVAELEIQPERVERLLLANERDPWSSPALLKKLSAVVRDGEPMDEFEVAVNLPERGRRVMTFTARRIPAERESLVLLVITDVTERATETADLLANSQRKDEFLAMLAHELRHPLTPITHAIHMLRLADSDPATEELYETIDKQSRRLVRFVNQLLDDVRISRGLLEISRERLDLVELVRETAESMRPVADERHHSLTLSVGGEPVLVDGDSGRLSQVVTNLLENAIKYTNSGGQISVTLERRGEEAVLSVRDTGVGIPPALLDAIFDPFTQADSALARSAGGLGLGLSVVRRVVTLHGGRVEARSRGRDAGSEFVVWLPTAPRNAGQTPRPVSLAKTPSTNGGDANRRKVLVVDDREEVTRSVSRLVRAFGHEVAVAGDAAKAMAVAADFKPDSAIVDLGLPGVSGFDLARQLREAFPNDQLYLIAFTGHSDDKLFEKCQAAGFDTCLVKPGDAAVLERLLRERPQPANQATN